MVAQRLRNHAQIKLGGMIPCSPNPNAGLDWPERLLVIQDSAGAVWTIYTDFAWIAALHGIANRDVVQDGINGDCVHHVERKGLRHEPT